MKNRILSRRLREYSLAATVILLAKSKSEGQIVYHNYNPDLHLSSDTYLDLNSDGVDDLQFNMFAFFNGSGTYSYSYVTLSYSNWVSIRGVNHGALAVSPYGYSLLKLNPGQIVNSSMSWCQCSELLEREFGDFVNSSFGYSGNWLGVDDGYFGFRLKVGNDKYYGWMRMGISPVVVIKEYAYNVAPNQPIAVGDDGCDWLNATIEVSPADTVCNGSLITLTANPSLGYSYLWKKMGSSNLTNATDSAYQVTSGTGDYFVIVSASNGCYDTSNVVHVAHINPMQATIYQHNDTLFSNLTNVYAWYLNGDSIPGATNYFYVADVSGYYHVVTHAGDCYATSSEFYFAVSNTSVIEGDTYPKIVNQNSALTIQMNPAENEMTQFSIVELPGRKIIELSSDQSRIIIPTGKLTTGEYLLVIQNKKKQTVFKFFRS